MTRTYDFVTLDVFTDTAFGGNPLAVFPDAEGLTEAQMQALANEFNLSETTFVLPPQDPAHSARVRIFNRTAEMPFAGHPNVGTGFVLAGMGRDQGGRLVFEELAGLVEVQVDRDGAGGLKGAWIAAPQPLTTGAHFSRDQIALCAELNVHDLITRAHPPLQASVGVDFVIAEVTEEALDRATPDLAGFEAVARSTHGFSMRLSLHLYARTASGLIRARMFSPLTGTVEDPATGSANAALAALLLSLSDQDETAFEVSQGVEMGRPSRLSLRARRTPDGCRAWVGGGCVPMMRGQVSL